MKLFLVFVLVALSLAEAATIGRGEKYTTKYDNVNLDEILASDRLIDNYFNCIMGRGKCTPDGTELKGECRAFWHPLPRVVTLQNQRSYLHIMYLSNVSNIQFRKIIVYQHEVNIFSELLEVGIAFF